MQVYQGIMSLSLGARMEHPHGVLKPERLPQLADGSWHVRMPLASHRGPTSEDELRRLVVDVLHGLASLHDLAIVPRDVRPPNILRVSPGLFLSRHEVQLIGYFTES